MPKIDLCFSGWIRGVEVTKATDVAMLTDVSVANMSVEELVSALESRKLVIGLEECLEANHAEDHIELFDFAVPECGLTELADAAFSQMAGKVQEKAAQSGTPVIAED